MASPRRPLPRSLAGIARLVRASRVTMAKVKYHGVLQVGEDFACGKGLVVATTSPVRFGDRVHIARGFHCEVAVDAGNDILISSNVAFIGNDHDFGSSDTTVFSGERLPTSTVTLGGNNLLGFGVIVVGNVKIGRGAIVGAGSLVTKDLPDNYICVGRPARPIRPRFETN
jgi:acetyltransferase-like isoleucine patch superfamily enzyme